MAGGIHIPSFQGTHTGNDATKYALNTLRILANTLKVVCDTQGSLSMPSPQQMVQSANRNDCYKASTEIKRSL
jgi:hypothetical protein